MQEVWRSRYELVFSPWAPVCLQAKAEARPEEEGVDPATVLELQREVEDLKLRLHMAAEHYKEKYKECQRLQRQVAKHSEQQGVSLGHSHARATDTHAHTNQRTLNQSDKMGLFSRLVGTEENPCGGGHNSSSVCEPRHISARYTLTSSLC